MNVRTQREDTEARLLGVPELCAYTSMGRNTAVPFARQCGAEMRVGKRCLYDRKKIDAAIDKIMQQNGGGE